MQTQLKNEVKPQGPVTEEVPDMAIVLVCWNNKAYLGPCLDTLYDGNLQSSCEIVVVDNGSTDGSQAMLREQYPEVRIIQNDHNVGLGKASNQGIVATKSRHVLLLNNDTLVYGAALDAMVRFLDAHPDAGAVGGRILNEDRSVQTCYNDFSTLTEEFLIATRLGPRLREEYPAYTNGDEIREVGYISSACVLVRRATLDEIGLLDEEYFIYGDEADLQYRLQQDAVTISHPAGSIEIRLQPALERRLGAFRLPVIPMQFHFRGLDEHQRREFLDRFDLHFQRGGG